MRADYMNPREDDQEPRQCYTKHFVISCLLNGLFIVRLFWGPVDFLTGRKLC